MADAIQVAVHVLDLMGSVTTMKLQKLVYYAQARYIVQVGSPLFADRIEAWANGPVVPNLFYKHSGKYMIGKGDLDTVGFSPALSHAQKKAIEEVVKRLGSFSGEQLRELTHGESPWRDARKGYKPGERCANEIPVEAMRRYYASSACTNSIAR